jgi:hypothetical protein
MAALRPLAVALLLSARARLALDIFRRSGKWGGDHGY